MQLKLYIYRCLLSYLSALCIFYYVYLVFIYLQKLLQMSANYNMTCPQKQLRNTILMD